MTRTLRWLLTGLACVLVPALVWSQSSVPSNGVLAQFYANVQARGFNYAVEQLAYTVGNLPGTPGNLINVLAYAGVDRTGVTDSKAGLTNALADACTAPVKGVYFPPGTYRLMSQLNLNVATVCNGIVLFSDPGGATLLADPSNTSSPRILNTLRQDGFTIDGLIFDGGVNQGATSTNSLITISGPSRHFTVQNIVCQNSPGTCIVGGNNAAVSMTTTATSTGGIDNTLTVGGGVPVGVVPGAYFQGVEIDPDIYVTAVGATTVTLSKTLTDTLFAGAMRLTFGFTANADVNGYSTVIPTSSTLNLSANQSIWSGASPCVVPKTRIVSIVANTSVTIDTPTLCKISSGTVFGAISGVSDVVIKNSRFENIGMNQRNLGALSVTTSGSTSSGATTVVFSCKSGSCASGIGVITGDKTAASGLPAGMPASDLVVNGPIINTGAGTFSVDLASPTTGIIANGTSVPFAVGGPSGIGYAIQFLFSGWIANQDIDITGNTFRHTWSSPIFVHATKNLLMQGNTYNEDWLEFQGATVAPSACFGVSFTISTKIIGEYCNGATGNGTENNHNISMLMQEVTLANNGQAGAYFCGGHDYQIGGIFQNNGQQNALPSALVVPTTYYAGIAIDGSCTGNQPGTISNVMFDVVNSSDDQATPTQSWAISRGRTQGTLSNVIIANVTSSGNIGGVVNMTPSISACGGGSPALSTGSTDALGTVTEGTTATGCVITFNSPRAAAPTCQLTSPNNTAFTSISVSTTALTIVNGSASGNVYTYRCSP